MKRIGFFLLVFWGVWTGFSGSALAADLSGNQPPAPYSVFSTYSADSPPKGRSVVALSVEKAGKPDYWRYSSQMALGITNSIEFGLNLPYVDNGVSGVEDIAVTLKHRFFDEGRYGPSVAYLLTGSFASRNDDLSTKGRGGGGIIFSKRIGPVKAHLNGFYTVPWDKDLEDEIRVSGGLDFSASHDFKILAEFYAVKSHFSKDKVDQREARVGYRFIHNRDVFYTIGIGIGLEDEAPEYRLMASLSLMFPRTSAPPQRIYQEEE
jgi:hypothetical protein